MSNLIKLEYLEYLNTAKGALKYNQFKKILYGTPDSLVKKLFEILYPTLSGKKSISIIDIGSGDGKRIILLKKYFKKAGISTDITAVEPSKVFVKNINKGAGIKAVNATFEKFNTSNKYDLVLLVHSIFTFKGTSYIRKLKKLLKKDGLLCVVSNNQKSFLSELKTILDEGKGSRLEINSVLRDLKEIGFIYNTKAFDTIFSGCVKNNVLTSKGKIILEWIALRPINLIPKAQLKKAINCFIKHSTKGFIKEKEVVVLVRHT